MFLLRYVARCCTRACSFLVRSHADLLHAFAPTAAIVMALPAGLRAASEAGSSPAACSRRWTASPTPRAWPRPDRSSHRIELEGRNDEFRELADAFDAMLARLEAQVAEQQRFAANASHELRTPLAITQTLLDVARKDPSRDNGELVERLHAVNTRAIDLTEALLLLSRADQRSFVREHVDLSLIAEEATETLLPLAEERGVTIETSGEVTPASARPRSCCRWRRTSCTTRSCTTSPSAGTVWVTTSVDRRGRDAHRREHRRAAQPHSWSPRSPSRFSAAAERVHTDHAGVGLGLAIVKSIVQAHDGTLTLTPRPDGGLRVTVHLPADTSAQ